MDRRKGTDLRFARRALQTYGGGWDLRSAFPAANENTRNERTPDSSQMPGLGFERGDALVVIDKMLQQKLELIVDAGKR